MYQVLQDFTLLIKGAGYVTAGVLLIGFVVFWYWLTGAETKRRSKRVHQPK